MDQLTPPDHIRDELERRVAERTAELAQANARLQAEIAEREHAEEVLSRYARRLAILHHIDRAILAAKTPQQIAQVAFDQIRRLVHCGQLSLLLLDEGGKEATIFSIDKEGPIDLSGNDRLLVQSGEHLRRLQQGLHHHVPNLQMLSDPTYPETQLLKMGLQTYVNLPLICRGELVGSLSLAGATAYQFKPEHIEIAAEVADQLAIAVEQTKLYTTLEEALQQEQATRAQLVQTGKLAAVGRMVASVAHELNNPLQAIYNVFWMLSQENLSEKIQEEVDVAMAEAKRMASLIGRLRETYRPVRSYTFLAESLNKIVHEVEKIIRGHLRQQRVNFVFEADPALPNVLGIRDQLKQIILNLSLNAVEMMEEGGTLTICTGYRESDRLVYLMIEDTGPGINAADLPNIFDPFFTTKETGTGLGLAITYDIVQRHNGRIDVDSQPGQGTIFTVWFPAMKRMRKPMT